jgi:predicted ArsR family transcriptional regulator
MRDTIDMAREAGFGDMSLRNRLVFIADVSELKAFEALVRADERDRAMRENAYVQAEREACAKVCESEAEMFKSCAYGANDGRYDWKEDGARECAVAIRARGNT